MQLLTLILKKVELIDEVVHELAAAGVHGGTIINATGMASELVNFEDLSMFGLIRGMMSSSEKEESKVLMFVLPDDMVKITADIIKKVTGDLNKPNTGIMFAVPITYSEGLGA